MQAVIKYTYNEESGRYELSADVESKALEELCKLIPDRLPKPVKVIGTGCAGTCYLTNHPDWVLKVTASENEERAMMMLLKDLPDKVCDVLEVMHVKDDITLIWKEKCSTEYKEWTEEQHQELRNSVGAIGIRDCSGSNIGLDRNGNLVVFDPYTYL